MNYGKNQRALLRFLEKYPNIVHVIKGRKAINAATGLYMVNIIDMIKHKQYAAVCYRMPQMLIKQN